MRIKQCSPCYYYKYWKHGGCVKHTCLFKATKDAAGIWSGIIPIARIPECSLANSGKGGTDGRANQNRGKRGAW